MTNYNALSREERKQHVELIRLGCAPDPEPLNYTNAETFAETFVARYYFRTDLFAQEMLGVTLDEWQFEVALDVDAGEREISIRSCHGVGKSSILAIISVKFLLTRWRCKIAMTAPTAGQLFDGLYSEVISMLHRLPEDIRSAFNAKSDRIEMVATPADAFLSVKTASRDRPEALQGVHSDFVLLVCDEASGIPDEVFDAAGSSTSGANCTIIMTGNPTRLKGQFYESHRGSSMKHRWKRYHVSKYPDESIPDGTRHYVSSRITDDYEASRIARYGQDSDDYRVRVLGDFPLSDNDAFIRADIVEEAMRREFERHWQDRWTWAIDPARYGPDTTAFGKRHGRTILPIESRRKLDTMQTAGWIKSEWDATMPSERPVEIFIDAIGIGAGVYDRLHELGLPVRAVNVSESPSVGNTYGRLRDELWGKTKLALEAKMIALPKDEELLGDLTAPSYKHMSNGRLQIESKEDMRRRGLKSPDKGDVACMLIALADDFAIYGEANTARSWGQPLERGLHATI